MFTCPWSVSELRRLSKHIRDETAVSGDHPPYAEVMEWYNDLAAGVQRRIADLNWPPLLLERPFEVTSRPKTIDTLRQKLQRDRSTPLQNVQDIAGVRFEAETSLDEQDAVVNAICGIFDHNPKGKDVVRDMRAIPHSGYRAVHIWLRLPARVEVQVRTHLQGEWANTYESAADLIGRGIRYEELPTDEGERDLVEGLRNLSTVNIASIEADRNEIANIELSIEDLQRQGVTNIPTDISRRLKVLKERNHAKEKFVQDRLVAWRLIFEQMRGRKA